MISPELVLLARTAYAITIKGATNPSNMSNNRLNFFLHVHTLDNQLMAHQKHQMFSPPGVMNVMSQAIAGMTVLEIGQNSTAVSMHAVMF